MRNGNARVRKRLPPLDLIRGFEAAARNLSFTKAASELFLTQSAVSRQVQALEEHLGVALFQRRHRALLLTDEGQVLYRTVAALLRDLRDTLDQIAGMHGARMVTVTTMVTFASLWLVPRLPAFRKLHPDVDVRISADNEIVDIERARIDVAVRYCAPERAPAGAIKLFGEDVMPMCAPALTREKSRPLAAPADLRQHVLLHMDDAAIFNPYLDWPVWLQAMGLADLEPAGEVRFSHYDQMIQAALDGQGVVLGRMPLLANHMRHKRLVAPFERRALAGRAPSSSRGNYVVTRPRSAERAEVRAFVDWLQQEAAADR
jgi:LysR family transcriptional regulator, glycine cleavage system transcriptional activator